MLPTAVSPGNCRLRHSTISVVDSLTDPWKVPHVIRLQVKLCVTQPLHQARSHRIHDTGSYLGQSGRYLSSVKGPWQNVPSNWNLAVCTWHWRSEMSWLPPAQPKFKADWRIFSSLIRMPCCQPGAFFLIHDLRTQIWAVPSSQLPLYRQISDRELCCI